MQHAMQHAEMIMQQCHTETLMRLKENAAFKPGLEHKESLEEQIIGKVDPGSMQRAKMIIHVQLTEMHGVTTVDPGGGEDALIMIIQHAEINAVPKVELGGEEVAIMEHAAGGGEVAIMQQPEMIDYTATQR